MIPERMLPNTNHPSILSILQCENDTVLNVLVDQVIVFIAYTAVNILIQGFFIALLKYIHGLLRSLVLFTLFTICCFGASRISSFGFPVNLF